MFQKIFSVVVLSLAFILLTAMGGTGGGFERAPRVEKNFSVIIIDASGTKIEGEKFSWEGRVYFGGNVGLAQVTIPFDKVKELTVGEKRDRQVKVVARLTDGSETSFDIDVKSRCFGEAQFGSFMLYVNEIKTVTFKRR